MMISTSNLTISDAARLIRSKKLSPVELTQFMINQIKKIDDKIKAWVIVLEEEALHEARNAEKVLFSQNLSNTLFGIPYGVKDLFYTNGVATTAGAKVKPDFIPTEDAEVIQRLRACGSILLGKTTLTEYASVGGNTPPTRNPWNLEHTPGGSSSGSAAAVAAGMALFTLGTQTAGSLTRPASYNGLVSIKATYDLISRKGVIPSSNSLDHVGAFTKTVEDAAIVLTELVEKKDSTAYIDALNQSIKGVIIGIPDTFFFEDIDSEVDASVKKALKLLEENGAILKSVRLPASFEDNLLANKVIMRVEAASYHADLYQNYKDRYSPMLKEELELGMHTPAIDYIKAQKVRSKYREEMMRLFHNVDVIATPATPSPAPKGISSTGSPIFNAPFSSLGVPTIAIPVGFAMESNLPLGLQLAAKPYCEEILISLGHLYQLNTDWHQKKPNLS